MPIKEQEIIDNGAFEIDVLPPRAQDLGAPDAREETEREERPDAGLRRAGMHVAAFRDAAATALNLGHARGTAVLERHYRGLATRAEGEAYWRILPSPGPLPPPEPLPGRGRRTDLLPTTARER